MSVLLRVADAVHPTSIHSPSLISLEPTALTFHLDFSLVFIEERRFLRSIREEQHCDNAHEDSWSPLHDEEEPPIGDGDVGVLDAKRDEPAECTGNSSKSKPIRHAYTHLMLRVPES